MNGQVELTVGLKKNGTIIVINPTIEIKIADKLALTQKIEAILMPGEKNDYSIDFSILKNPNEALQYLCFSISNNYGAYEEANPYDNEECINIDQEFSVLDPYPNPSETYMKVPVILPAPGSCQLQLTSENGSNVLAKTFKDLVAGLNTIELDLTPYRNGIYLLTIKFSGIDITKKIVIR